MDKILSSVTEITTQSIPRPMPIPTPMPTPSPIPTPLPISDIKNPILDSFGVLPIANQLWNGNKYIRLDNTNYDKGISIQKDPIFKEYKKKISKPKAPLNVINKNNNTTLLKNLSTILPSNLNIIPSRRIKNYGNSCYFGSFMHYLFAMRDLTNSIINNANYATTANPSQKQIYIYLRNLIRSMADTRRQNTVIDNVEFARYLDVKEELTGDANLAQEDASECMRNFTDNLNTPLQNYFKFNSTTNRYYAAAPNQLITNRTTEIPEWRITVNYINAMPNSTLEEVLESSYGNTDFQEKGDAIEYIAGVEYLYGWRVEVFDNLPQYLNIILANMDFATKYMHNIKINTTLSLQTGVQTKQYLLLAMVIHYGSSSNSGHYTSLVLTGRTNNSLIYTYYNDDAPVITHQVSLTATTIDPNIYNRGVNATPYMVLYGDISKM